MAVQVVRRGDKRLGDEERSGRLSNFDNGKRRASVTENPRTTIWERAAK